MLLLIKGMNPIRLEEIDEEDEGAEGPGEGIGPGHGGKLRDEPYRYRDIGDAEYAPAAQHDHHRYRGLARAAEHAGDAMGEGHQAIEQADGTHVLSAEGYGILRSTEKANEGRGEKVGQQTYRLGHGAAAQRAEGHAFHHPFVLAGTQILPHKGGEGLAEAGDRKKRKALQFGIGAATRHSVLAEIVDIGLHHHVGDGDDAVLYTRGHTVAQDIP